jgi:esterase
MIPPRACFSLVLPLIRPFTTSSFVPLPVSSALPLHFTRLLLGYNTNYKTLQDKLLHTADSPDNSPNYPAELSEKPPIPLIFLHCLLGNSATFNNFHGHLHSALSKVKLAANCYFLDLRNHGKSPHSVNHDYNYLVADSARFIAEKINNSVPTNSHQSNGRNDSNFPIIIGHSQGGKTALAYSLLEKSHSLPPTRAIISLDASPASYSHTHSAIFSAMANINWAKVRGKNDVEGQLAAMNIEKNDRAFILSNLSYNPTENRFSWSCNTEILAQNEPKIHDFPFVREEAPLCYEKPVLFVGGSKSTRLTTPSYTQNIGKLYPRARIELVNSGHFVFLGEGRKVAEIMAEFMKL